MIKRITREYCHEYKPPHFAQSRSRLTGAANGSCSPLRVSSSSLPSQHDGGSCSSREACPLRSSTYYHTALRSSFLIRGIGGNPATHGLSLPDRGHEKQHFFRAQVGTLKPYISIISNGKTRNINHCWRARTVGVDRHIQRRGDQNPCGEY